MKLSVFICNGCLKKAIGDNHASHWRTLKAEGWVKGEKVNKHYCQECAKRERHEAPQAAEEKPNG